MVSSQNQRINIMYHNGNYLFLLVHHKKKLDSSHEQSSPHFKDELWFPIKRRVQMVSLRNQCINIMYHNGNYLFRLVRHEKKIDSYHERSLSHFKDKLRYPTKWKVQIFFTKTMQQYHISQWKLAISLGPSQKEPRFFSQTKFIPF